MFSAFPLMIKDQLVLIFWLTFTGFLILSLQRFYIHLNQISLRQFAFVRDRWSIFAHRSPFFHFQSLFSLLSAIPLLIGAMVLKPPARYPDLWPVLISAASCLYFLLTLLQFHLYQWREMRSSVSNMKKARWWWFIDENGWIREVFLFDEHQIERCGCSRGDAARRKIKSNEIKKKKVMNEEMTEFFSFQ